MIAEKCRLCGSPADFFFSDEFFHCKNCNSIFRGKNFLPEPEKEKSRYDLHQNNPDDSGYLQFVSPVTNYILKNFTTENNGLDFGSGPASAILRLLQKNNYCVIPFDPFYQNEPEVLEKKYDFIICCEVVEHFHQPKKEFENLKNTLSPDGELLIMTHLWDPAVDFEKWYYKNDFTHVFFYSKETFDWIKKQFGFKNLIIVGRFIRLKN